MAPALLVLFALAAARPDGGAPRAPKPDAGLTRAPTLDAGAAQAPQADPNGSRDAGAPSDVGAPTTDGGLTPAELDRLALVAAAKERQGDVFACYAAALRDAPGLKGMIRMAWTVELDGSTSGVHVDETDLDAPDFHTCLTSSIRVWRFPRPTGGAPVKIAYKWTLNPKTRR